MAHKLVLLVRTDLAMGRGKIAAQAAHAAVAAALAGLGRSDCDAWLAQGQPMVVLRSDSADALSQTAAAASAVGLPVEIISDAGRTQVPSGTPTCCAIGPAEAARLDEVTGRLPLL
ncbi:MAG TPA: aminoacyl-tRNA hydrolase [Streptosporangiaceae bacterium]|jgi:PTH2 family peptidyl-tRNA hydrolase